MKQLALLAWSLACALIAVVGGFKLGAYYIGLEPDDMPWFLYYAIRAGFHIFAHEDMPSPEDMGTVSWLVYLIVSIVLVSILVGVTGTILWQRFVTRRFTFMKRCKNLYKQSTATKVGGCLWSVAIYVCVFIVTVSFLDSVAEEQGHIEPQWAFVSLLLVPIAVGAASAIIGRKQWLKGFIVGTVVLWVLSLFVVHAVSHMDWGFG
jgi:hypothetical protein